MKNAIDWASRGPNGNLFNDKPGLVVSAGGGVGGLRSQEHLRDCALFLNMHMMNTPQLMVQIFNQPSPFQSDTGDLNDETTETRVAKVMHAFIAWTRRLGPPVC